MSKTECELLLKQMETKLDDLQVKWAKHQKDISDRMKTAVSDLTKSGTADRQDISQLTTKINEIQLKVSDGSDHGSGINFRAFSDENSDPSAWWRDFESCAEFKKYSEEKQLSALKVLLKGSAGVWLDRTLTNDIPDTDSCAEKLKKIKKAFIDKFEKNNTWLDEHLIHFMSQRPHEPIQKYYSRLMTKVARLDKTPQEILVIFVKGLRHQLKYYVLSREPGELEAAFKLAKSAESLKYQTWQGAMKRPNRLRFLVRWCLRGGNHKCPALSTPLTGTCSPSLAVSGVKWGGYVRKLAKFRGTMTGQAPYLDVGTAIFPAIPCGIADPECGIYNCIEPLGHPLT